ncbi:LysR family transcriptional regulator [Pseudomonas luteola]
MFNWDDLRFFLELQRSGRLLSAARRMGTSHTTVARHIESLERTLGTQLLVQHTQGYQLTPAGQALLKHAEAMEESALLAQEEMTCSVNPLGQVRLGVTEGLGTGFLSGRLATLLERYPGLEIELVSVPRFVSITNREADIAITLERPSADLVIARKLSSYCLQLYASPAYLEKAPPLHSREDLSRQRWIGYVDDLIFTKELLFLQTMCKHPQVAFRSTSVLAQQMAAQAGIGIAILPYYLGSRDPLLIPVLPQERVIRHYWISSRRELHRTVRLRVVWDFLVGLCEQHQHVLMGQAAEQDGPDA